ncbi:putative receptor protein kinase ZmPK1 [Tanacetum coccineum]
MTDNTALLQALQAIQQLQQQSRKLQQQTEQSTKILEALDIREQPKHDHKVYGSSSDEDKEGDQVDPANHQRNRMPRIKVGIPTFSGSLNIENFLDWVSEKEKYFELMDITEESQVKYVAYKLRGAASSWWDNLQTSRRFKRFNNGLRYDIKAIVSLQTWTIDEVVRIVLSMPRSRSYLKSMSQCRAAKHVNLAEREKANSESEDDGLMLFLKMMMIIINQDAFNVIIDGGSSKNIISRDIVTRLKLTPKKHQKPYKIGWIKVVGEVRVTEQCEVLFAMRKYKDTILFDIVDMDACHVLLGIPWQSDLNVVHRGNENTYTFSKDGHKFTLCPYSDEVQATTAKVKKNQIMLCSTSKRIYVQLLFPRTRC